MIFVVAGTLGHPGRQPPRERGRYDGGDDAAYHTPDEDGPPEGEVRAERVVIHKL